MEIVNPISPTTMPEMTRGKPPASDIPVISSNPATTSARPEAAVALSPKFVASLPAAGATTTAARVMGRKKSPAASGPCPSTTWKWSVSA